MKPPVALPPLTALTLATLLSACTVNVTERPTSSFGPARVTTTPLLYRACIYNSTGMNLRIWFSSYNSLNANWQSRTVEAGTWEQFTWSSGTRASARQVYLRVDRDLSPGAAWRTFTVPAAYSPSASCNATNPSYELKYSGPGIINLYRR